MGGRVIVDWPGLAAAQLHEGRDLVPTMDLRSITKAVVTDHLAIPAVRVENVVFPDSAAAAPVRGLFRT